MELFPNASRILTATQMSAEIRTTCWHASPPCSWKAATNNSHLRLVRIPARSKERRHTGASGFNPSQRQPQNYHFSAETRGPPFTFNRTRECPGSDRQRCHEQPPSPETCAWTEARRRAG